jgi:predicted nucleic acid-binding protein
MAETKELLANCILLHITDSAIEEQAIVKAASLDKEKPMPENDIRIAAVAIKRQFRLTLLTSTSKKWMASNY